MAFIAAAAKAVVGFFAAHKAIAFGAKVLGLVLLNNVTKKLFGEESEPVARQTFNISSNSSTAARKKVFGTTRIASVGRFKHLGQADNVNYHVVQYFCEGPVTDITDIWIDNREIPDINISWEPDWNAFDTSPQRSVPSVTAGVFNGFLHLERFKGDPDQVASDILSNSAGGKWTSSHRLRGCCFGYFRMTNRPPNSGETFPWDSGQPQNFRAVIAGPPIYDARQDGTEGFSPDGGQRQTDKTTWAYSENPIWQAVSIATDDDPVYGGKLDWEDVNIASAAAAADRCDELVTTPAGDQPRFFGNGGLELVGKPRVWIESMLTSCLGTVQEIGGQLFFRAGGWDAPEFQIDESDLRGDVSIDWNATYSDRYNTVTAIYTDPVTLTERESLDITDATFVAADGGTIRKRINLPFVQDEYLAQRICWYILQQSRNQITVQLPLKKTLVDLAQHDVIELSISELGWSNKTFRVTRVDIDLEEGGLDVTAVEETEASWDDPALGDYVTLTETTDTAPTSVTPSAPTGITVTPVAGGNRLNWSNNNSEAYRSTIIYASQTNSFATASQIAKVTGQQFKHELFEGETYFYWFQNEGRNFRTSIFEPPSTDSPDDTPYTGTALEQQIFPIDDDEATSPSVVTNQNKPSWDFGRYKITTPIGADQTDAINDAISRKKHIEFFDMERSEGTVDIPVDTKVIFHADAGLWRPGEHRVE